MLTYIYLYRIIYVIHATFKLGLEVFSVSTSPYIHIKYTCNSDRKYRTITGHLFFEPIFSLNTNRWLLFNIDNS